VKRYQGEPLPEQPLIAVVANDALGNYVASTPLLQMLRSKFEDCILHYYSGTRTAELWANDPNIDWGFPLLGTEPATALLESELVRADEEGDVQTYDLVINLEWSSWPKCFASAIADDETFVCGPALAPDGRKDWEFPADDRGDLWRDQDWIRPNLANDYGFLKTGFIGEIFCRLAYLDGAVPEYEVARQPVRRKIPDVLIATTASLPEKLWTTDKWLSALEHIRTRGHTIGLIGAKPKEQAAFWLGATDESRIASSGLVEDLRGALSLPQVVEALSQAKQVLTIDNGILHLAVAAGTPTIGLFRYRFSNLWAPPAKDLKVLTPPAGQDVEAIPLAEVLSAL
jgi:ADP-heptose:LPS heptosyltransferase